MESIPINCSKCGDGKVYPFKGKGNREELIQRKLEEDWVCINENVYCIECATELMITSYSS